LNHWLERISAELRGSPPKGWETSNEIAERTKKSLSWVQKETRKALAAGAIEMDYFYRQTRQGLSRIPHYRELKPAKK